MLPLMLVCGMIGGAAYAAIPAFLKARLNTNEILTSLMLVYVAQLLLDWTVRGPWRNPEGFNFPETRNFQCRLCDSAADHRNRKDPLGLRIRADCGARVVVHHAATLKGFEISGAGPDPAGRAVCRLLRQEDGLFRDFLIVRRAGRPCRHIGGVRRDRPAAPGHFARLRLHRHHRGVSGTAQSARHRGGRSHSGADLSRRRGGADLHWHHRQGDSVCSRGCFCSSCSDATRLIHYRIRMVTGAAQKGSAA
jgi:hypothetical protein